MDRSLVVYPNPLLYQKSVPVTEFGPVLDEIIEEMTWVLRVQCSTGLGIAAIQCGVPLRVSILERNYLSKKKGRPQVLVNPEVLKVEGEQDGDEGCLSFPGKVYQVRRPNLVQLRYQDQRGREGYEIFTGLWARCVLHEVDHLDGVLIVGRVKEQGRSTE